jgi:hypothetical protein
VEQHIFAKYTWAVIAVVVLVKMREGLSIQRVVLCVVSNLISELDLRRRDIDLGCLGADRDQRLKSEKL